MNHYTGKLYREIPTSFLKCRRSDRRSGDPDLDGLCENIARVGILHPLTVRYCGEGEYEIVSGVRRYLAAVTVGLERVPCLVTSGTEEEDPLLSLSENIQRKNLNYFEQAQAMQTLISQNGITREQLAKSLGKSPSAIANKLRLLQLSPELREKLLSGGLSERHARALLSVEGETLRRKVLKVTLSGDLRVSQMEAYIEKIKREAARPTEPKTVRKGFCRDIRLYLNSINRTVDLMKHSGFRTHCETSEDVSKIVYRIEIAK